MDRIGIRLQQQQQQQRIASPQQQHVTDDPLKSVTNLKIAVQKEEGSIKQSHSAGGVQVRDPRGGGRSRPGRTQGHEREPRAVCLTPGR